MTDLSRREFRQLGQKLIEGRTGAVVVGGTRQARRVRLTLWPVASRSSNSGARSPTATPTPSGCAHRIEVLVTGAENALERLARKTSHCVGLVVVWRRLIEGVVGWTRQRLTTYLRREASVAPSRPPSSFLSAARRRRGKSMGWVRPSAAECRRPWAPPRASASTRAPLDGQGEEKQRASTSGQ